VIKVAFMVALSIFFTCTLFFVIYGMAYLVVTKTIKYVKKVGKKDENRKLS
tara:strand:+ start:115 stop:267 length:153 start_codon:yes stop_codon:yes gene_type:complete